MCTPRAASLLFICLGSLIATHSARSQTTPSPSAPAQTLPAQPSAAPPIATATASPQPAAALPDPKTPAEFFARARQLSDLEASGIPFHLKATFVATGGEFKGNGTYEEWWKDENHWRKEATLGDFRYVAFKNGQGGTEIYTSSNDVPSPLQSILDGFLINIPADAGTFGKWKMQHKKIKKAKLIFLRQDGPCVPDQKFAEEECIQQGFFTSEGLIRVLMVNGVTTVYNNFRSFRDFVIPYTILTGDGNLNHNLTVSINQMESLDQSVNLIESLDQSVNLGEVPTDLRLLPVNPENPYKSGGGVKPPRLLNSTQAQFPPSMRRPPGQSFQQIVIVQATINTHGNLQEAKVVHSGGTAFDNSALQAVRQYKFAPATYLGMPIAVQIKINVEFHEF